jgi:hypothetical protein
MAYKSFVHVIVSRTIHTLLHPNPIKPRAFDEYEKENAAKQGLV